MSDTLGDRIRKARLARGMTQQQLATEVGVTRASVSQWENGDIKGLRSENLVLASIALDEPIDLLVFGRRLAGLRVGDLPPPAYAKHKASEPLRPDEQQLIDAYRLLDPIDRDDLVGQLLDRAERAKRYMVKAQAK